MPICSASRRASSISARGTLGLSAVTATAFVAERQEGRLGDDGAVDAAAERHGRFAEAAQHVQQAVALGRQVRGQGWGGRGFHIVDDKPFGAASQAFGERRREPADSRQNQPAHAGARRVRLPFRQPPVRRVQSWQDVRLSLPLCVSHKPFIHFLFLLHHGEGMRLALPPANRSFSGTRRIHSLHQEAGMKIKPLGDRIVIRRFEAEGKTAGGILSAGRRQEQAAEGQGPGRRPRQAQQGRQAHAAGRQGRRHGAVHQLGRRRVQGEPAATTSS